MSAHRKVQNDILLETGTNELEVLEFTVGGNSYGINVAKVKELVRPHPVQALPRSHPFIEGIFQPRNNEVYTLVNLPEYLGLGQAEDTGKDIFIICSFNKMNIAFHVHGVEVIHRISWDAIEKPDATIYGGDDGIVTGIAKVRDRIIAIIDFEKIIFDISPDSGIQMSDLDRLSERGRIERPILIAEDSELLRRMLLEALHKAGYQQVIVTDNGQEAWDKLLELKAQPGALEDHVSLVITDIEMPRMDGHHLTKRIREDSVLGKLPVVIFSSLINDQMRVKGIEVGASAQLSKPDIGNLVDIVDQFVL